MAVTLRNFNANNLFRRYRRGMHLPQRSLGAAAVGIAMLIVPAQAAVLPVFTPYERLAERPVTPAPLVPTYVPPLLAQRGGSVELGYHLGKAYMIRIVHDGPSGPGVIALTRCEPLGSVPFGTCSRLAATVRFYRNAGYSSRRVRIRGRNGFLMTRPDRRGPTRSLIWREDGLVHTLGSATPRTVSLRELRATAAGLDHLEHKYLGSLPTATSASGAVLVTTERFVAGPIEWHAACDAPDGRGRAGSVTLELFPREGNRFDVDLGTTPTLNGDRWVGSISGTISPTEILLTIRATGTFDGAPCDTGALSITLKKSDGASP